MRGLSFPVDKYYLDNIVEGTTISRAGGWWSAALVIEDPSSEKPFLGLYKWQKRGEEWKKTTSFKINSKKDLQKLRSILDEFEKLLQ